MEGGACVYLEDLRLKVIVPLCMGKGSECKTIEVYVDYIGVWKNNYR